MVIALTNFIHNTNMYMGIFPYRMEISINLNLSPQSGEQTAINIGDAAPTSSTTALHFDEALPGKKTTIKSSYKMDNINNPELGLHDFLSRPVRIASYRWEVGTFLSYFNDALMSNFLSNKRVSNRINNFSYLNCTVNVRIIITGSPMHYGLGISAINPWLSTDTNLNVAGNVTSPTLNQLTQLPHVWLDPSTSSAGEISIPLILPYNALNITDATSVSDCLTLHTTSITPLGAVSATAPDTFVNIWMWLTDVQLSNPTGVNLPSLTPQSGDEYGKPTISRTATTIAQYAEYGTQIPVIAPYARATQMVANGAASIAELFGYSSPNDLAPNMPMSIRNVGQLAQYNATDTSNKLALDAKNEVTIDPKIVGVDLGDEMALSSIFTREGYLGSVQWNHNDTSTTPLFRGAVAPTVCRSFIAPVTLNRNQDMTPLAFAALPFEYWRGTIRYRIVVSCSAFHRGRLRVVFDPLQQLGVGPIAPWALETNITQSYIMDLSNQKELTVDIPWACNRPYLPTTFPHEILHTFTSTELLTNVNPGVNCNGMIGIHVLTPLASPDENASVVVHVFISGHSDLEFQEPGSKFASYHLTGYVPQSGMEVPMFTGAEKPKYDAEDSNENDILGTLQVYDNTKLATIHWGERIVSIRQLLKRYVMNSVIGAADGNVTLVRWQIWNNDFPAYKGWSTTATTIDTALKKYNFARDHYLHYFSLAYLARRGGIRHKYIISALPSTNPVLELCAARAPSISAAAVNMSLMSVGTPSSFANNINHAFDLRPGGTMVLGQQNTCVEFETPYYSHKKFHFAQQLEKNTTRTSTDDRHRESFHTVMAKYQPGGTNRYVHLTRYVAAGEDYSLAYFKYTPIICYGFSPSPG